MSFGFIALACTWQGYSSSRARENKLDRYLYALVAQQVTSVSVLRSSAEQEQRFCVFLYFIDPVRTKACCVAWLDTILHLLKALRLDYLVQKVRPILTKLMSAGTGPQRGLFNVPVDPLKLGIPDYFKRVPHPMDLVSGRPQAAGVRHNFVRFVFISILLILDVQSRKSENDRRKPDASLFCRFG